MPFSYLPQQLALEVRQDALDLLQGLRVYVAMKFVS